MSKLPVVTELPIDGRTGNFSLPWRQWLQTVDRALGDAGTDTAALAVQVAAIATALGSPDGTVENIPDQDSLDFVIVGDNGITVTGTPESGRVTVSMSATEIGANLVYAGPATGADDAATFRALVNADLPDMANKTIKARKTAATGDPEDCTVSEVLDFVPGTPTKGDLIVRDTSASARIAAGTSGHVLTSNGAGALPTYQAAAGMTNPMTTSGDIIYGGASGVPTRLPKATDGNVLTLVSGLPAWGVSTSGSMALLGTATVAGSAATTLTLSGLDLSAYKAFVVHFSLDNATASAGLISLYYNSDTTATNYYNQRITLNNTAVSGNRSNDALIGSLVASEPIVGSFIIIRDLDGRPRARAFTNVGAPAAVILQDFGHVRNNTANVTDITLSSNVANAFAIGSKFSVFGVN